MAAAVSGRRTPEGSQPASEIGIELNVTTFWMPMASKSGEIASDCGGHSLRNLVRWWVPNVLGKLYVV